MTKFCPSCNEDKPIEAFSKSHSRKDGLQPRCKVCCAASTKAWKTANKETNYAINKRWSSNNKEALREYHRDRYQKNKAAELARCSEKRVVRNLSRNTALSKIHKEEIKNFYWLAKDLELVSGQKYHVDHIVPLQGDNVCGLHVPWNLQVLPADINLSKGNKHGNLA